MSARTHRIIAELWLLAVLLTLPVGLWLVHF